MRIKLTLLLLNFVSIVWAQLGPKYTYEFLSMPASSRITALGGVGTLVKDFDVNLASQNPTLLNKEMDGSISLNHNFHFADISNGHFGFGKEIKGVMTHIAFSYMNYGEFKRTNSLDEDLGTFKAADKSIIIGAAKQLNDRITVGVNLKGVFSNLDNFTSNGLAMDAAISYENPEANSIFTFLIKNYGRELNTYNEKALKAPLDIQIGFSKKLKYLPLRFSVIGHQLQQWSIRYDDPNEKKPSNLFGESKEPSAFTKSIDNFFRHIIFNTELSIGKTGGFKLRGAYNHLRRSELNLSNFRSLAGFSLGFGLKIKQFNIDYGIGYYHLAGAANHLSISTKLDRFKKQL